MRSRLRVNITPWERVARVVVGLIGVVGGLLLLLGAPTVLTGTLEVLLALAGVDLVVTGVLGHCPLYHKLGYVPTSSRRSS
ncbi:MAG TPA: DUF2892 domain-containing protein [Actinomycetes bacterium]